MFLVSLQAEHNFILLEDFFVVEAVVDSDTHQEWYEEADYEEALFGCAYKVHRICSIAVGTTRTG